jgi:hypothetical protein
MTASVIMHDSGLNKENATVVAVAPWLSLQGFIDSSKRIVVAMNWRMKRRCHAPLASFQRPPILATSCIFTAHAKASIFISRIGFYSRTRIGMR